MEWKKKQNLKIRSTGDEAWWWFIPKQKAIFINLEVNTKVWGRLCVLTHANNTANPSWSLLREQRRQCTPGQCGPADKSKQAEGVAATLILYCMPVANSTDMKCHYIVMWPHLSVGLINFMTECKLILRLQQVVCLKETQQLNTNCGL